ncbi:hypothetical protein AK812_SmicGene4292 [Symbiodinium microadriaticum]|uniref:E3 ubiquitin-protein ligase HERC2 n=1 Tax=Symbiodinium microadriaticum TaxID=2951 RepID=A0A1Q9EWK9_SYMMI|nr:hypothetical protein AK812_SmicGene4292 [Symbiodinium microadriaticum]
MSITVDVGLLSGKTASVKAGLDEEVGALKRRAQIALGVGGGRLVDSSGSVLDACAPIRCTRLRNGELLALHISRIQVQASCLSFAAILGDGSVVTWGRAEHGGNSSAVQDQLKNVQQIQASHFAFAAVLADGSVVTWGSAASGGDSSAVQDQLKNVQQIQASNGAFAAIVGDGSVVTWGDAVDGGDSSAVQDQLKNVQQIQTSNGAFAAIVGDGSVVTWGCSAHGGDSSAVQASSDALVRLQNGQDLAVSMEEGNCLKIAGPFSGLPKSEEEDETGDVSDAADPSGAFRPLRGSIGEFGFGEKVLVDLRPRVQTSAVWPLQASVPSLGIPFRGQAARLVALRTIVENEDVRGLPGPDVLGVTRDGGLFSKSIRIQSETAMVNEDP